MEALVEVLFIVYKKTTVTHVDTVLTKLQYSLALAAK